MGIGVDKYNSNPRYFHPKTNSYMFLSQIFPEISCDYHLKSIRTDDSSLSGGIPLDYRLIAERMPAKELASIIRDIYASTPEEIEENIISWQEKVAPPEAIRIDYDFGLSERNRLLWGGANQAKDLLIRAIPGHASSGHCHFREYDRTFSNTMSVDVVNALEEFPYKYRIGSFEKYASRTQEQINEIVYFFEDFFSDYEKTHQITKNRSGNYISNLKVLKKKNFRMNMIQGMQGFYFCAFMDNYETIRKGVKEKYGFEMGGGRTYAADINKLKEFNIGLKELSSGDYKIPFLNYISYEKLISVFEHLEILYESKLDLNSMKNLSWDNILENGIDPRNYPEKDIRKVYIREKKGSGVADDLAICNAGFLPNIHSFIDPYLDEYTILSRIISGFFADKIDTLEKDSLIILPGGQDESAGIYVNELFRRASLEEKFRQVHNICSNQEDLIPFDVLVDYTAASAILNLPIHSSQRYFLRKQSVNSGNIKRNTCTLKELIRISNINAEKRGFNSIPLFEDDRTIPQISVGFSGVPLREVSNQLSIRLNAIVGCDIYNILTNPNKRQKNIEYLLSNRRFD